MNGPIQARPPRISCPRSLPLSGLRFRLVAFGYGVLLVPHPVVPQGEIDSSAILGGKSTSSARTRSQQPCFFAHSVTLLIPAGGLIKTSCTRSATAAIASSNAGPGACLRQIDSKSTARALFHYFMGNLGDRVGNDIGPVPSLIPRLRRHDTFRCSEYDRLRHRLTIPGLVEVIR